MPGVKILANTKFWMSQLYLHTVVKYVAEFSSRLKLSSPFFFLSLFCLPTRGDCGTQQCQAGIVMSRGGSALSSSALLVVGGHVWISIHSFPWDHTWLQEKTCLTFCCLANSLSSFLPSQTSLFMELFFSTSHISILLTYPQLRTVSIPYACKHEQMDT